MLLQSFIDSDLWDEAYIEQSPIFLKEGVAAPTIQKKYFKESERYFGRDFLHACYPQAHRQNTSD